MLTQESPILEMLMDECPDDASLFLNTFYLPTSQSLPMGNNSRFRYPSNLMQSYLSYCPDCINQENLTVFQDVKLPVCPIHNRKIIITCPKCCCREKWQNANLNRCKCGFFRKLAMSETISLIDNKTLDIFNREHSIHELNQLSAVIEASNTLWNERKHHDNSTPFYFHREFNDHIIQMAAEQLRIYPGFTLNMHLAPWTSQVGNVYPLIYEYIKYHYNSNYHCNPATCCSSIALTGKELRICLEHRNYIEIQNIIKTQLIKQVHHHGNVDFYASLNPICEIIKYTNTAEPYPTLHPPIKKLELIGTIEASLLLGCSSSTVHWLADHGYLKHGHENKIRGTGHKILIKHSSLAAFGKRYILVGEISSLINASPREVVKITNRLKITPTHSLRGPYVFFRRDIQKSMELLLSETTKRNPQPSVIEPEVDTSTITIKKTHTSKNHCETCKSVHYRTNTVHQILGTSARLIRQRFFLSGLIHPHTTERGIFCAQKEINYMRAHLQKHVSITQATKMIGCSAGKLNRLLNSLEIKPSCKIKYPDNEIQHLYLRTDIEAIIHQY